MKIKQYDRVILDNGNYAYIVEIFDNGNVFLADIDTKAGTETDWIKKEEIKKIIS